MRKKTIRLALLAFVFAALTSQTCLAEEKLSAGEAKQSAEEAFIYGFPLVMNYTVFYEYFIDKSGREYKVPPNQL